MSGIEFSFSPYIENYSLALTFLNVHPFLIQIIDIFNFIIWNQLSIFIRNSFFVCF